MQIYGKFLKSYKISGVYSKNIVIFMEFYCFLSLVPKTFIVHQWFSAIHTVQKFCYNQLKFTIASRNIRLSVSYENYAHFYAHIEV